jgi:predicted DNA-binding protein
MTTMTTKTHNFHVPLSAPLYKRLKDTAARQHKPATQLVKQAVEHWLADQEKLAVHEEIAAYASAMAGSNEDLDSSLESASADFLADEQVSR